MKALTFAGLRTATEIALWRHGWAWLLAAVLAGIAALGYLAVLQPSRQVLGAAQRELAEQRKGPEAPPPGSSSNHALDSQQQRLQALRAALSPSQNTGELVRRMVALAQAEQINLAQSDYQQQVNKGIGVTRVQISQPVRASYPQLRRYVEAVLQAIPNASLDQVMAKRDSVAQAQVEARLKWSLWSYAATESTPVAAPKDGMP
jgi:hypothetical protein